MSRQFTIISSQTRNRLKWELQSLPLQSLISVTEQIMNHFSPVNMYNHNISSFCQSYSDTDGRIQFILSALDQGVVTPNQLPHALKRACGITDSDRKIVPAGFTLQKRKDAESGRDEVVLTDELEVTPTQQVQISNPRWEPIAAEEDSDSEASADLEDPFLDETIKLLADVKNYPDGASVSFDIYDVTEGTPMRIATVTGTNSGGTASAEWKVEDPQERGDTLKLQFEAGARSKYTEKTDLPVQEKLTCDFVEMPDVLFHHNSAVPCLDGEAILLGALTATILFAKENTGKEIVIFGHTDTSGDPAYNFDLSAWRAEGIKALLGGDKDSWLDVVYLASKVEDYQTILATLYTTYGWECDPGSVDNTDGPKTKAAIKSFQEEFNSRYQGALKADGMIGPKTWGALFDTVCSLLKEVLQEETGDTVLPTLTYGYSGSGLYPCGESFPVDSADKDGYKSAANRRVEIVFYDAGKAPKLIKPADKKKVTKREAPVYDKKRVEKKPIPVKQPVIDSDTLVLDIVFPQINDASKPHKQYVNLPANGKAEGVELTIKVKAKDLKANTTGKRVYWRVTADANNSKRNSPKIGVMEKAGAALVEFAGGIANIDTAFNGRESSIILACGLAGGDKFTVEVGTDGENFTKSFVVENWRKLWYQLTHEKGLALPSFAITEKTWADMFVEIKKGNKKEFEKTDCLALEKQHIHTFYNEYVINPGGSDKDVAVMGSHNSSFFHKMYTNDQTQSPKVHFIVCQHQWDESATITKKMTVICTSKDSPEVDVKADVFFPYLKGKIISSGSWKSLASNGHADYGKAGNITDEWIVLEKKRKSRTHIKFRIPDTVGITPGNDSKVQLIYKLKTVSGPYLGESDGHQILAVSDPKDPTDFNNTLSHEAAHSFNQVPEPGSIPPGLAKHSNQYTGCGGIGSHCNTISDKNNEGMVGKLNKDGEYSTGVCVMYHAGDSSCINKFCSVCEPYVKAADFSSFNKV